jgi:hypothetical protein
MCARLNRALFPLLMALLVRLPLGQSVVEQVLCFEPSAFLFTSGYVVIHSLKHPTYPRALEDLCHLPSSLQTLS